MADKKRSDELERVIGEWQERLFRFAYYRTGSPADAQDIVQNVFLKMYDSVGSSQIGNVKSYLYRSVANGCSNYHRNKRSTIPADKAVLQAEDNDAGEWMREYERIRGMLDSLPAEQAETIRMRCIDGLAFTEIAEILNIPATTAKSRFRYGIDKLKSKIK